MNGRQVRAALDKLAKWRTFFASWQLGTREREDPECNAVKDHREVTMLLRAELTALTGLLVRKGVFDEEAFQQALGDEALLLDHDYEVRWPGFSTSEEGLHLDLPLAADTMRKMHFKP